MNEQLTEPTEISPEKTTKLRKPDRNEVREQRCYLCDQPIGNRDFQMSGKDLICLDCGYETGEGGG